MPRRFFLSTFFSSIYNNAQSRSVNRQSCTFVLMLLLLSLASRFHRPLCLINNNETGPLLAIICLMLASNHRPHHAPSIITCCASASDRVQKSLIFIFWWWSVSHLIQTISCMFPLLFNIPDDRSVVCARKRLFNSTNNKKTELNNERIFNLNLKPQES